MSDTEDQTEAELAKTRRVVAETVAEQSKAAEQAILPAEETAEAADELDEITEGWSAYTKEELADELRTRGLAVSGTKDELVARLDEDDATEET